MYNLSNGWPTLAQKSKQIKASSQYKIRKFKWPVGFGIEPLLFEIFLSNF